MKLTQQLLDLDQAIRDLRSAAERVYELSADMMTVEKNAYVILRQIDMLEIQICDPVGVMKEVPTSAPDPASDR